MAIQYLVCIKHNPYPEKNIYMANALFHLQKIIGMANKHSHLQKHYKSFWFTKLLFWYKGKIYSPCLLNCRLPSKSDSLIILIVSMILSNKQNALQSKI